jgi:hypothetical protein
MSEGLKRAIAAARHTQERVVAEKQELDEKLEKLLAFIGDGKGPIFSTLVTEEQERLTTQARIMREYSDILTDRIAAFGGK